MSSEIPRGCVVGAIDPLKAVDHRPFQVEALLGQPVCLKSRLKVLRNWFSSSAALTRLAVFPEKGAVMSVAPELLGKSWSASARRTWNIAPIRGAALATPATSSRTALRSC